MDLAMVAVVRLVCAPSWNAESAGRALRSQVPDTGVLHSARARAAMAAADREGPIADRAVATVDAALALGPAVTA